MGAANVARTNTEQIKTEVPVQPSTERMITASAAPTYTDKEVLAFKKGVEAGSKLRELGDAEVYAELGFCKDTLRSLVKAWDKPTADGLTQMVEILKQVHNELGAADGKNKNLYDTVVVPRMDQQPAADTVVLERENQQLTPATAVVEPKNQQPPADTVGVEREDQ